MENSRRSFFRTLLAPLITFALPKRGLSDLNGLSEEINDGINPEWDGTFKPKYYSVNIPYTLDDINITTLRYIQNNSLPDSIFAQSPFSALMIKKEYILDAGGSIIGQFGRMPGKPWERLHSGLRWPEAGPRLPD